MAPVPPADVIDEAVARAVQRALAAVGREVDPGVAERVQPPAMPFWRGRDDDPEDDVIDLRAPEHRWWAAGDEPDGTADPAAPDEPGAAGPAAPAGDDAGPPNAGGTRRDADPDDPYAVLRVPPSADWGTIVAAYRKLARWYHPDGLTNPTPEELAACEEMIRRLNAAYAELRVRRGR